MKRGKGIGLFALALLLVGILVLCLPKAHAGPILDERINSIGCQVELGISFPEDYFANESDEDSSEESQDESGIAHTSSEVLQIHSTFSM